MKVGFIGLGIMGKPMAKNLLAAGHQVVVSSHNQTTAAELAAAGATVADTPKQIAEQVGSGDHHAAELTRREGRRARR